MKIPLPLPSPYHIVHIRPWPLLTPTLVATAAVSIIGKIYTVPTIPLTLLTILIIISTSVWWRDIIREATLGGYHTIKVQVGLSISIVIFIASEVIFFFAFFWAFFHSRLRPSYQVGSQWPPTIITPLNPFSIPLLNTGVLLSSGVSVTWSHHAILGAKIKEALTALALTVILGFYFTSLQLVEYLDAPFTFNDRVYGSTFFLATGFHGAHVIIGTTFLLISLLRIARSHFSYHHHFGFEAAAWYWHFVDVVWVFLYIFLYWWGRN